MEQNEVNQSGRVSPLSVWESLEGLFQSNPKVMSEKKEVIRWRLEKEQLIKKHMEEMELLREKFETFDFVKDNNELQQHCLALEEENDQLKEELELMSRKVMKVFGMLEAERRKQIANEKKARRNSKKSSEYVKKRKSSQLFRQKKK